jgi:hypothetical protein
MRYTVLKSVFTLLFGVWCVVYFSGATWVISHPSDGQQIPHYQNVAGSGVGPASTNYEFRFKRQGNYIQVVAGTSTAAGPWPAPQDQGNWSANLVPPTAAPFSGSWPTGAAFVEIWEDDNFKEGQAIVITNP